MKFKLGLLDFGYRSNVKYGVEILDDVFDYAISADEMGFSNYWLGEHHNSGFAWSNPEILIPLIAAQTNKISIGIAGILLSAHSPYRVALNFKLLETIFPGRIDLGLANGNIKADVAQKLSGLSIGNDEYLVNFKSKSIELLGYFKKEESTLKSIGLFVPPYGGNSPRIWKLSTTLTDLVECTENKMSFCQSIFHSKTDPEYNRELILDFKQAFFKTNGFYPEIKIAFSGVCSKTTKEAQKEFEFLDLKNNPSSHSIVVGTPEFFKEKLSEIHEKSGIDDFVFYDRSKLFKNRMRNLKLLSKTFELA